MANRWLPSVACSWLLLFPPNTGNKAVWTLPRDVNFETAMKAVFTPLDADLKAPFSQWRQERAFDSAEACERWKTAMEEIRARELAFNHEFYRQHHPDDTTRDVVSEQAEKERIEAGRCLPATVVVR
jgi:hypothetical protein